MVAPIDERATGRAHVLFIRRCLQARNTETGNRITYRCGLTLKHPARHRNSQRRIAQMPKFHKSLPHARTFWGEETKVPS
jgi:hypothetical protein